MDEKSDAIPASMRGDIVEEITKDVFKKVVAHEFSEDSQSEEAAGGEVWEETEYHRVTQDIYTIGATGGDIVVVGGEDRVEVSGTWEGQSYARTDVYGAAEPITKDGEYYLPWHIAAALTQSGKIEEMTKDELVGFLEEAYRLYTEGSAADKAALEAAGGRSGYIQQEAARLAQEGRFGGSVAVAAEHIDTNWHNYGPHKWHQAVSFANAFCETGVY